ncbi:50S ribosomal protein L22 [Candidatus Woesearchaeota archaeon]|nr:50S ribosomal protein L22 [Candidatus Woesearchaeota archaeon]MDP1694159.1 50S ribosomal protein L22 [Candidatus Woesearchaeota archaeon]
MTDEHTATATISNVPISTKQSVEICSAVRGKSLVKAKAFLERVMRMEEAVPYRRFKMNVAHKPGPMAAGRYPVKSCKFVLALLNSVESNAQDKGLDTDKLYIHTILANKASRGYRAGRTRGIKARNTNVKVIVAEWEVKEKKEKPAPKEAPKKQETKQ